MLRIAYISFLIFVLALPGASLAGDSPFVEVKNSELNDAGEYTFRGKVTLEGTLWYDARDELSFVPNDNSGKKLPGYFVNKDNSIGLANDVSLRKKYNSAIKEIDVEKICAFSIKSVKIVVSDYNYGEGPAGRWYNATLVGIVKLGTLHYVKCDLPKASVGRTRLVKAARRMSNKGGS